MNLGNIYAGEFWFELKGKEYSVRSVKEGRALGNWDLMCISENLYLGRYPRLEDIKSELGV